MTCDSVSSERNGEGDREKLAESLSESVSISLPLSRSVAAWAQHAEWGDELLALTSVSQKPRSEQASYKKKGKKHMASLWALEMPDVLFNHTFLFSFSSVIIRSTTLFASLCSSVWWLRFSILAWSLIGGRARKWKRCILHLPPSAFSTFVHCFASFPTERKIDLQNKYFLIFTNIFSRWDQSHSFLPSQPAPTLRPSSAMVFIFYWFAYLNLTVPLTVPLACTVLTVVKMIFATIWFREIKDQLQLKRPKRRSFSEVSSPRSRRATRKRVSWYVSSFSSLFSSFLLFTCQLSNQC